MKEIDKIAFIYIKDGKILSTLSKGKDTYYIPGGKEDFENIIDNSSREILENDVISGNIYNDFMNNKIIVREDRTTYMDFWVSYIAFIFDFNYKIGLEYIKEMDYINVIINRLDYKNKETKQKMENIRKHALEYIENSLKCER